VRFYEPSFQLGNYEEFVFDTWDGQTDTVRSADTLYYSEIVLWTEVYEYDANDQLKRVIKFSGSQDPMFFYGPNKEIAIKEDLFSFNERISDTARVAMTIRNESESVLKLSTEFDAENFSTEQNTMVLPPQKEKSFAFQLIIQPQINEYTVTLRNDSISMDITVKTIGYNVESNDVSQENQISVDGSFVYWRSGNEALVRIYDKEQANVMRTFSLAQEITTVDLKGIKPGDYMLCKRDFSADQQTCCKLMVAK
jgi:hypothetical protein